jgi:hypothetical protein
MQKAKKSIARQNNMDKYYRDVKDFFFNVNINGSYFERAKTVVTFLRLSRSNQNDTSKYIHIKINNFGFKFVIYCCENSFFCISKSQYLSYTWSINVIENSLAEFDNDRTNYVIGEQTRLDPVNDFRRKVIMAINSAESLGGSLLQKRDQFKQSCKYFLTIFKLYKTN